MSTSTRQFVVAVLITLCTVQGAGIVASPQATPEARTAPLSRSWKAIRGSAMTVMGDVDEALLRRTYDDLRAFRAAMARRLLLADNSKPRSTRSIEPSP